MTASGLSEELGTLQSRVLSTLTEAQAFAVMSRFRSQGTEVTIVTVAVFPVQ